MTAAASTAADSGSPSYRNPVDWLFRNRQTGAITIGAPPNKLVLIASIARALRFVVPKGGRADQARRAVATGALIAWSVDETVRGVNPFRRIVGASTLVVQIGMWVRQFRR